MQLTNYSLNVYHIVCSKSIKKVLRAAIKASDTLYDIFDVIIAQRDEYAIVEDEPEDEEEEEE